MLEPLTALSVATSIIQFVDFGCKLIGKGHAVYKSVDGATESNMHLEQVTTRLVEYSEKLAKSLDANGATLSSKDRALEELRKRCLDLALKLRKMLEDIKVDPSLKGFLRGWDSICKAVAGVRKESEIKDIARQLDDYRQQMALHLLAILEHDQSTVLREIRRLEDTTTRLELQGIDNVNSCKQELLKALQQFKKQDTNDKDRVLSSLHDISIKIEDMTKQSSRLATKASIMDSLYFPDMDERKLRIKPAYAETFSWIFNTNETSFVSWLQSGSDIFWVRGKAGSGKSTLMKYLGGHHEVKKSLRQWAGHSRLVRASAYFWSPGSALQKSQEGLLQSLLFQIFKELPDVIPVTVPRRWEATQLSFKRRERWTKEELAEALHKVVQNQRDSVRFFFFVDGLDEYWGDLEQSGDRAGPNHSKVSLEDVHPRAKADQHTLIMFLQGMAALDNVKFCVSSRPWTAFHNAFGQDPDRMLTLEQLTAGDIEKYVEGELKTDSRFTALALRDDRAIEIVSQIREKALGVFLWVYLVVRDLLRGLTQGDGVDELTQRLHAFPSDLKDFFREILYTIDDFYRPMTCRLLKLADYAAPLPWMTFWYLQLERDNPLYAEETAVKHSPDAQSLLFSTASSTVNKWCRDLLEVQQGPTSFGQGSVYVPTIDFLHRTVRDFLLDIEVRSFLEAHAGKDFNEPLSMCRALLAKAKTLPPQHQMTSTNFQELAQGIMHHANMLEMNNLTLARSILKELDQVGTQYHGTYSIGHWTNSIPADTAGYGSGDVHINTGQGHSNFLAFAVSHDLRLYVQTQLSLDASLIHKSGRPLLDYAIHRTFPRPQSGGHEVLVDMVQLLLQNGANPNEHAHLWGSLTVWQAFLYSCYHEWEGGDTARTASLLLRYGSEKNYSTVVASNLSTGQLQYATVKECLSRVLSPEEVNAILKTAEAHTARSWSQWLLGWRAA